MGNCQATEAATVVIQHPGGRVERLYWPTPASEVMRSNPGHYVALITLCLPEEPRRPENGVGGVRFTRVRLLRPKDTLVLGQVYRLFTSQEVVKGLRARKQEKMDLIKQNQKQREEQRMEAAVAGEEQQRGRRSSESAAGGRRLVDPEKDAQVAKQERNRQKPAAKSTDRPRHWRPSLQSISEVGS